MLLSARRVGPSGKAYGLDMTDEMLSIARDNAAKAGARNVEFLKGHIESIPLPDQTVDVIISNCVINLSGNKAAVFAESFRVLRPGGRFGVSDILAEDDLTEADRAERGRHVGCIAGAAVLHRVPGRPGPGGLHRRQHHAHSRGHPRNALGHRPGGQAIGPR